MKKNILFFLLLLPWALFAQNALLQSGPMVGYVEMREALLWAQTTEEAEVYFTYWDTASVQNNRIIGTTTKVKTEKSKAFTAKCLTELLEPGKVYAYQLHINGKPVNLPYPTLFRTQHLWQFRTDPPPFTLAVGSCAYVNEELYDRPGRAYGGFYDIFKSIHANHPDVMLWLGDNAYLREADWYSQQGINHRYTHSRSLKELQPLLASTQHHAIWDDHDYGPNDSNRSWHLKEETWNTFQNFWGNRTFGVNGNKGITSFFQYADIEFFLLDNRYFRSPNNCETCDRTILGKDQIDWLIESLSESRAPFKMVAMGGQFLSTVEGGEVYIHKNRAERDTILARIERDSIKGVVFLTGDVHFAEFSALKNGAGNMIYDLTVSPLTAGPYANPTGINANRVEGTLFTARNYALLSFSGPRKAREMRINLYDTYNKPIWEKTIKATDIYDK